MFKRGANDDNPLGGLGTTTVAAPPPVALAGPSAKPARRSDGPLLLVFSLVTVLATAGVLWREERAAVKTKHAEQAIARTTGLTELSLLRSANLRRAIDAAVAKVPAGTVVLNLTVKPTDLEIIFRQPDEHSRTVDVDPRFKVQLYGQAPNDNNGIAPSAIDTGAPARMIAAVTKRTGLPASRVDHVNFYVNSINHDQNWNLELADVPSDKSSFTADGHGADVRRPGEPDAATRAQQLANARQQQAIQRHVAAVQRAARRRAKLRDRCFRAATTNSQLARCAQL
jgi:hypothetical protein